jgi:Dipeptidyl peptidase IV (DPP IV) N-terminal region
LPQQLLSWTEYIVRVGWLSPFHSPQHGRSSVLWAQLLDRLQQRTAFVAFDVDSQSCELIAEENMKPFLNVTGSFYSFSSNPNLVIIGSERDGFHHLYLYERQELHGQSQWLLRKQLTQGQWQVNFGDQFFVDESRGLVYFTGTKDSPLENHIYVTAINDPQGVVHRLTPPGYFFNNVTFNSDRSLFVANFSNISKSHRCMVFVRQDSSDGKSELAASSPSFAPIFEIDFAFGNTSPTSPSETSFKVV